MSVPYDKKEIDIRTYKGDKNFDPARNRHLNKLILILGNLYMYFTTEGEASYASLMSNLLSEGDKQFILNLERDLFAVAKELYRDEGLDLVRSKVSQWSGNKNNPRFCKELFGYLVLIYVKMRENGYSRESLVT